MKKVIFLSVVWTATVLVFLLILTGDFSSGYSPTKAQPLASPVIMGTGIVLLIFAADVLILWILSKIGGPLKADVKATVKKFGGSLFIAGVGLMGCFLAIAITAFAGIYLISKLMGQ
jgi:hypothetical protein